MDDRRTPAIFNDDAFFKGLGNLPGMGRHLVPFLRQTMRRVCAPSLPALSAASMATFPPPMTQTFPLRGILCPFFTDRRKSRPHKTPESPDPSMASLLPNWFPDAIRTASYLPVRSATWTLALPLKLTPTSQMERRSSSRAASGSRYPGLHSATCPRQGCPCRKPRRCDRDRPGSKPQSDRTDLIR